MKIFPLASPKNRGVSLIEAVIAMGVLAVAIPVVFGALAKSGSSGLDSEAETRSTWIVPICVNEIAASRDAKPEFFTTTAVAQAFPPTGEVWALAFSREGKVIGKVSKSLYDAGLKQLGGQEVRYVATLSAVAPTVVTGAVPMLSAKISLEYPSAAPVAKRQKLDFYSRIP
jgi:Tfp pilus assembly protein PilV